MFRTALLAATLLLPAAASAQSAPPEVMEHYRVYAAELKKADPDNRLMSEAAYDAWQEAESRLGDSKLTGDLAINFAETEAYTVRGEAVDIDDAYERAVELASFYPEEERASVAANRALLHAQRVINRYNDPAKLRRVRRLLDGVIDDLKAAGLGDSTYTGDAETLKSQAFIRSGRYKSALKHADLARAAYERTTDGLFSVIRYQLPLFDAIAAQELKQDVRAGKALQKLVEDHYRLTEQYTGPSAVAYSRWLDLEERLQRRRDEPEIAALLEWTPPAASGTDEPAYRTPPIMPPTAQRSGWVDLEFDLREDGRIDMDTVRVTDASESTFESASKFALKAWVYPPGMPEESRRDVETRITFFLSRPNGTIIPARREAPPKDG